MASRGRSSGNQPSSAIPGSSAWHNDAVRAAVPERVVYKKVGEEMVLLDFDRGIYYGLNTVGARVWELLAEGKTTDEIIDLLTGEFDVQRTVATGDVSPLKDDHGANGLLNSECPP